MLKNQELQAKIALIISEQLNLKENEIVYDHTFEKLGADVIDHIEILMRTEEVFNVEISDQEADEIICVGDLVNCVDNLISKQI